MPNNDDVKVRVSVDASGVKAGTEAAEKELRGFTEKGKGISAGWAAAIGGIAGGVATAALGLVRDSAQAIFGFFRDSVTEAAAAERSLNDLRHALGNIGVSYRDVEPAINRVVDGLARQTRYADDDLRDAFTNLVRVTGDVEGSMDRLSLVADLAAARNLDLSSASDLVGKAMAGNTTALSKLFPELKGNSDALDVLAAKLNGTAKDQAAGFEGRMAAVFKQLGEVKEAIGGVVTGGAPFTEWLGKGADLLANLAGWIAANAERLRGIVGTVVSVASALGELASTVWDVVGPPLVWLTKNVFGALLIATNVLVAGFRTFAASAKGAIGGVIEGLGWLAEKAGGVLKKFGIDIVSEGGAALRQYGAQMVHTAKEDANAAGVALAQNLSNLLSKKKEHEGQFTELHKGGNRDRGKDDDQFYAAAQAKALTHATTLKTIVVTAQSEIGQKALEIRSLIDNQGTSWETLKERVNQFNAQLQAARTSTGQLGDTTEEAKNKTRSLTDAATLVARGLGDAAQAMGLLDAEAASTLDSVLNMVTAFGKLGVDQLGGIVGIIGGLANVIAGIGQSEAQRKLRELLARTSDALSRVANGLDTFNLGATGKTIAGVQTALGGITGIDLNAKGTAAQAVEGSKALGQFLQGTLAQGVSRADLTQLLGDLGIDPEVLKDPVAFFRILPQLQEALGRLQFGKAGGSFESQLSNIEKGFDLFGTKDADKLTSFQDLITRFAPKLAGAFGSKEGLEALARDLLAGKVSAADAGGLSASALLDFISKVLPLLAAGGGAGGGGGTGGASSAGADLGLGGTRGIGIGGEPGKGPDFGLPPIGDTGLPGIGGSRGLSLPALDPPKFPALVPSIESGVSGIVGVRDGFGASGTPSVVEMTGDVVLQYGPVEMRDDGLAPEQVAEKLATHVARVLGHRYTLQRSSLGQST